MAGEVGRRRARPRARRPHLGKRKAVASGAGEDGDGAGEDGDESAGGRRGGAVDFGSLTVCSSDSALLL